MFDSLLTKTRKLHFFLNTYLPFLGAGIRVDYISDDFLAIDVRMPLYRGNKNYVGSHFGGSLYAMTDPFFMVMLMENLGKNYIVWDKAAQIDFITPGRGTVHAHFRLTQEEVERVRLAAESGKAVFPEYTIEVLSAEGLVVARIVKTLYVRKKKTKA